MHSVQNSEGCLHQKLAFIEFMLLTGKTLLFFTVAFAFSFPQAIWA
jgi:hypothetical protein